jgi:hypothetical protein
MTSFGQSEYSANRDATIQAYGRTERGGAETCTCAGCRNFRVARGRILPAKFVALLDQLGIDPRKDAEVYQIARVAPGRHDYGGWYHFVGTLDQTSDFAAIDFGDGFTAWMCYATAPRLPSLDGLPAVQLEFYAKAVPWLLDEPESI